MAKITHAPIIEPYPETYTGPKFLTLIEYGRETYCTIIDYATPTTVAAYVLDACGLEQISDVGVVTLIHNNWDEYNRKPVSVLFGALGIAKEMARVHRVFQLSDVTRVIGRFPTLDLSQTKTVKRRRRREVDPSLVKT